MICTAAICFAAAYHSFSQILKSESSVSFDLHFINQSKKQDITSARNQMILLIIVGMAYVYSGVLSLAYMLEK
jgi:hypothetical protein